MASRRDLEFTYSLTDRIIRLSLGELADFSGAKFIPAFRNGKPVESNVKIHAYYKPSS